MNAEDCVLYMLSYKQPSFSTNLMDTLFKQSVNLKIISV
jgi:hypothetical protein